MKRRTANVLWKKAASLKVGQCEPSPRKDFILLPNCKPWKVKRVPDAANKSANKNIHISLHNNKRCSRESVIYNRRAKSGLCVRCFPEASYNLQSILKIGGSALKSRDIFNILQGVLMVRYKHNWVLLSFCVRCRTTHNGLVVGCTKK